MESTAERAKGALSGVTVIVFGVLIALGADAAWEERTDRLREREVLSDLLEEFQENETLLEADIESNTRSEAAGTAWAGAMLGTAPVSSDSLLVLWVATTRWARFDPVTGALRSLLDGGELRIIQDQDLRRALAGWSDRAEEARNTSRDITVELSNLTPMLLSLQPGASHSPGERVAIANADLLLRRRNRQLIPLLQRLREIISLLEGQLGS